VRKDLEILSFSLGREDAWQLESLQKELGIASRSKLLRMALDCLSSERKALEGYKGIIGAILTVSHSPLADARVSSLHKGYEHLIKTQIHNTLESGCFELFFIEGEASEVRKMYAAFRGNPKVRNVKIFVL